MMMPLRREDSIVGKRLVMVGILSPALSEGKGAKAGKNSCKNSMRTVTGLIMILYWA